MFLKFNFALYSTDISQKNSKLFTRNEFLVTPSKESSLTTFSGQMPFT